MCLRLGRVEWKGGRFLQFSLEVYKMRGREGGIWCTMVLMPQDSIKQRSTGELHLMVQISLSSPPKKNDPTRKGEVFFFGGEGGI